MLNLAVKNLYIRGGISERQVRRLIAGGWEIDAHSRTHADLTAIGARQLASEVAGSRQELRRLFGIPVDFFCYPGGRYDRRVIAAVRAAGFRAATTTVDGLASPATPFELRRVRVSRGDGVSGFRAKIAGLRCIGVERILSDVREVAAMNELGHIDSETLILEATRYLAAVDAFGPRAASRCGSPSSSRFEPPRARHRFPPRAR